MNKLREISYEEKTFMRPRAANLAGGHGLCKTHKSFDTLPKLRPLGETTSSTIMEFESSYKSFFDLLLKMTTKTKRTTPTLRTSWTTRVTRATKTTKTTKPQRPQEAWEPWEPVWKFISRMHEKHENQFESFYRSSFQSSFELLLNTNILLKTVYAVRGIQFVQCKPFEDGYRCVLMWDYYWQMYHSIKHSR